MKKVLTSLITLYQRTVSPDHGALKHKYPHGFCRYSPSCSEYTKQAIEKYGSMRGLSKAAWRVVRCNPMSKGGVDKP